MESLTRLESLIGIENISKLKEETVLVVGLGGVGGHTLEALSRSGIGTLIIVDFDTIEESNLNRQLIATKDNLNKLKCDEWEKRISKISNTKVIKLPIFLSDLAILDNYKISFIVDACDTLKTKEALIKYALKNSIPCISCMGMAKRKDLTKIMITSLDKTSYDPIARKLRHDLKSVADYKKIMVVTSREEPVKQNVLGSNAYVPAVAGLYLAYYVIKEVLHD